MSNPTLDLESLTLAKGAHPSGAQMCIMEAVAFVAGEPWSDTPACASPILTKYLQNLNDTFDGDARQMLKPLIPMCIGTNTGEADEQMRGLMAVDWIVREYTPTWLELVKIDDLAAALRSMPAIESWDKLVEATSMLREAHKRAAAARAAAGAAAWGAARDAARAAAGDAARGAARAAAWDAARDAARAAAGDAARGAARAAAWDAARGAAWDDAWDDAWAAAGAAAWAAARAKLSPTVVRLQSSAIELAKRMAMVGK